MKSIYSKIDFWLFYYNRSFLFSSRFCIFKIKWPTNWIHSRRRFVTTNDYVSKVISNINIENRDDIIDLYAKSSEMAITCYSNSEGYVAYGNKKYNPTPEQMMAMFKSTNMSFPLSIIMRC